VKKKPFKYPRVEKENIAKNTAVKAFAANFARRVVTAEAVYEVAGTDHTKAHDEFQKNGYTILTHRECPSLLASGQMLLWPIDEASPKFSIDQRRRRISHITAKATKSELGQFLTPYTTACFMASLFESGNGNVCSLLDPGSGIGSLSDAFLKEKCLSFYKVHVTACEIDSKLIDELKETLQDIESDIVHGDFIELAVNWLQFEPKRRFTHAILNPPYKKIRSSSCTRKLLRHVGIETVNFYSAFVALSLKLLEHGGQLVAIIPRSFCNGPYYKPFRQMILKESVITHIHLFESRRDAFKEEGVLQENVIIKLVKGGTQGDVTISVSTSDSFADYRQEDRLFSDILKPMDTECFIHIPTALEQDQLDDLPGATCSLSDIGICVSTGPIVDYRVKDFLRQQPEQNTVPLLYPAHCSMNRIEWPKENIRKPNALIADGTIRKSLFPLGFYCVVKRFSSKEEKRRITASVVDPDVFGNSSVLAFENHLNVYHADRRSLHEYLAYGLPIYLNTSFVDQAFRRFNGHTQVNATDLRQLRYPSREKLIQIGHWAIRKKSLVPDEINCYVQEALS